MSALTPVPGLWIGDSAVLGDPLLHVPVEHAGDAVTPAAPVSDDLRAVIEHLGRQVTTLEALLVQTTARVQVLEVGQAGWQDRVETLAWEQRHMARHLQALDTAVAALQARTLAARWQRVVLWLRRVWNRH